MASAPNPDLLYLSLVAADEAGVKLEMVGGVGIWEAMPSPRHQRTIDVIRHTIRKVDSGGNGCGCVHYSDIYIRFDDGSFKRPDIAIYCEDVPDEESDNATPVIPEAVVEVVSRGYEAKDLEVAPPFLLSNGVKDVVVLNPFTQKVHHFRQEGTNVYDAPHDFVLECGCALTV